MSIGEIVVGGKCCRGNPGIRECGNPCGAVRCRVVSSRDVMCFFPIRHPEQGRRISRMQSVVTKTIPAA